MMRTGNNMVQARGDSIFQQQIVDASRGNSEEADDDAVPPMPITADGITEEYNHALPSEYTSQRTGTAPLALHN